VVFSDLLNKDKLSLSLRPELMPKSSIVSRAADVQGLLGTIEDQGCVVRVLAYFDFHAIALIDFPKISTDRIKRYGERGQPCLTPLCILKKLLDQPLFQIKLTILL